MSKFTNEKNISLAVAVWLAHDSYAHNSDPKQISATGLLTNVKELALKHHPDAVPVPEDIANLRASRVGTAVHDSIQDVWTTPEKRDKALRALDFPERLIGSVKVNPKAPSDNPQLDVYSEIRSSRELNGWTISGETDFYAEETFQDFKTTGTYTYQAGTKTEDYIAQLSIYRWIFQDLPSNGMGQIHFLFNNWDSSMINRPGYPQSDIVTMDLVLWSLDKTEAWIAQRLKEIEAAIAVLPDQTQMPTCTAKETWQGDSEFKYYAKAEAKRATKVFGSDAAGAYRHLQDKGTGFVKEFPGSPTYCLNYCSAFSLCDQGQSYKK